MPYALQWLKKIREEETSKILLYIKKETLKLIIDDNISIVYENSKDMENSTSIECKESDDCIAVEGHKIDVFVKDIKDILLNREIIINYFQIAYFNSLEDTKSPELIIPKFTEFLNELFNSRGRKLKVEYFVTNDIEVREAIEFALLLDPESFRFISFCSPYLKFNSDDFLPLVVWNRGSDLCLGFDTRQLSMEVLTEVKKLLHFSQTFNIIEVRYTKGLNMILEEFFTPFTFNRTTRKAQVALQFVLDDSPEKITSPTFHSVCVNWPKVFGALDFLEIILKYLDFLDIQRLRRVSRNLRYCIDKIKLDFRIDSYSLVDYNHSIFTIIGFGNPVFTRIEYMKNDNTNQEMQGLVRYVNCQDILSTFANDFEIDLKHQKSSLTEILIRSNRKSFLEKIADVLQSREGSLKVEKLSIWTHIDIYLWKFLLHIDPNFLKIIELGVPSKKIKYPENLDQPLFTVGDSYLLEQWTRAEKLIVDGVVLSDSIQKLKLPTFAEVDILINTISTDDMIYLRDILTASSILKKFKIQFKTAAIDDRLYEQMPPYRRINNIRSIWFFPMTSPGSFLHIVLHYERHLITIACVDRDSVPEEFL